ncbi:hypothetical protein CISG_01162 [Coccidioides immitis RMSCC 3703]|uniref:Uncharacterized protein n=1 Tax=Coccidioides immitis RMSCC 3703 TaxID=454286 RepID=A0A0J8QU61_COCIT|nr:hypothetical protein CISG_01162 [Coccidioides immitis RMSCC 3703]
MKTCMRNPRDGTSEQQNLRKDICLQSNGNPRTPDSNGTRNGPRRRLGDGLFFLSLLHHIQQQTHHPTNTQKHTQRRSNKMFSPPPAPALGNVLHESSGDVIFINVRTSATGPTTTVTTTPTTSTPAEEELIRNGPPGALWNTQQAQEDYRREWENVLDKDFNLDAFGDPFDERDMEMKS